MDERSCVGTMRVRCRTGRIEILNIQERHSFLSAWLSGHLSAAERPQKIVGFFCSLVVVLFAAIFLHKLIDVVVFFFNHGYLPLF